MEWGKRRQAPRRKNDKTLLLKAEHEAFQQLVVRKLRPLSKPQLSLPNGVTCVYRVA